jgi:hypothetical protein
MFQGAPSIVCSGMWSLLSGRNFSDEPAAHICWEDGGSRNPPPPPPRETLENVYKVTEWRQRISYVIIISLLSLRGHTASTKHLVLFEAIRLILLQLFPFSNASLWTDLRHVCLGLSLLLCPCGFQSKASRSMASFPFLNMSYPIPFPSFDLRGHLCVLCPSEYFIWNHFRPIDVQDSS